jgi:Homeobox KN domain
MEKDLPKQSEKDSKLLLAAVAMLNDVAHGTESNQNSAVTPLSSQRKPKTAGTGTTGCTATGSRNSVRKPTTLPNETVEYLKAWMMSPEHIAHPYPTETEKAKIMSDTGLELKQLTNWFVNNRKRYWKPRVEAHLSKEPELEAEAEAEASSSNSNALVGLKNNASSTSTGTSPSLETGKVAITPSPLRVSRRKGMKGKSHSMGEKGKSHSMGEKGKSHSMEEKGKSHSMGEKGKSHSMRETPVVVVTPTSLMCTSNTHLISGHNSLASQSDGTTSCSDSDDDRCTDKISRPMETIVQEKINVHILRPSRSSSTIPDLKDVSVLANIPSERILKTYSECLKGTKGSLEGICRDAAIVRLKKRCLSMFLAEHKYGTNISTEYETDDSVLLQSTRSTSRPNDEISTKRKYELHVIPSGCNHGQDSEATSYMLSPRPKYRRRSIDIWKEACQTANHVYDDDELPSLEEATRLFGYAN